MSRYFWGFGSNFQGVGFKVEIMMLVGHSCGISMADGCMLNGGHLRRFRVKGPLSQA